MQNSPVRPVRPVDQKRLDIREQARLERVERLLGDIPQFKRASRLFDERAYPPTPHRANLMTVRSKKRKAAMARKLRMATQESVELLREYRNWQPPVAT